MYGKILWNIAIRTLSVFLLERHIPRGPAGVKAKDVKRILIDNIAFCIIGVIFVFLTFVTRTLTVYGNLLWTPSFLVKSVSVSLVTGILIGFIVNYIFKIPEVYSNIKVFTLNKGLPKIEDEAENTNKKFQSNSKVLAAVFIGSLLLIFLSYIPYFLAYYPGILAYDSYIQIGQIFANEYNEHHPLFHTLMIKGALSIGENIFHSLNAGAAIYVLTQMLLLSMVFAYGILCLFKRGHRIFSLVTLLLLMLFPFNGFLAVSVTKDVPFSAFFLLFVISLIEFVSEESIKINLNVFLLGLSVIMCVLFRNNGKYAFAFTVLAVLIVLLIKVVKKPSTDGKDKKKKEVKKYAAILALIMATLIVSTLALTIISKSLHAVQGDRREMLSVPIQQLARTYVYHAGAGVKSEDDNTMDEASKALINEFLLYDSAKLYRQDISDPVKRNTNTWVVVNKTSEFAKVYLGLFVKYPGDYFNAFFAQNAGFIDIGDKSHAYVNDPDQIKGHGYVQTKWEDSLYNRGFYQDTKWQTLRNKFDTFADTNAYLGFPVIKYIFMPGIYLWIYVFAFVYAIKKKKAGAFLVISLIAGYYATMFFGPTVQLRYVYPVMIALPFIIPYIFRETEKDNG